jgi:hypothetical protein
MTDLHIHSCLSPCGGNDMTPADVVGLSLLNGQDLIALTDHNTAGNCPAAACAAVSYGIGFIPGIELTTSEDIHAVCLFPELDSALEFDRFLCRHLPEIRNRPDIFGEQILCGNDGAPRGTESRLLMVGSDISILDLPVIIAGYGGVCYPAHIDREGNGLLSILGAWPPELDVNAAEVWSGARGRVKSAGPRAWSGGDGAESGKRKVKSDGFGDDRGKKTEDSGEPGKFSGLPSGLPDGIKIIRASDAHRLADLPDRGFAMELESADFKGLAGWIRYGSA